jgi:hypothetical protein
LPNVFEVEAASGCHPPKFVTGKENVLGTSVPSPLEEKLELEPLKDNAVS